jgi:hypothetical protein
MEQAAGLVRSLQGKDRTDAQALMQIIIHEVLEDNLDDYADQARSVIASCRY